MFSGQVDVSSEEFKMLMNFYGMKLPDPSLPDSHDHHKPFQDKTPEEKPDTRAMQKMYPSKNKKPSKSSAKSHKKQSPTTHKVDFSRSQHSQSGRYGNLASDNNPDLSEKSNIFDQIKNIKKEIDISGFGESETVKSQNFVKEEFPSSENTSQEADTKFDSKQVHDIIPDPFKGNIYTPHVSDGCNSYDIARVRKNTC